MSFPNFSSRGLDRSFDKKNFVWCKRRRIYERRVPLEASQMNAGYASAPFESCEESRDAARDYAHTFEKWISILAPDAKCLDVGSGDGSFVRELRLRGLSQAAGLEPSREACRIALEQGTRLINQNFEDGTETSECSFDMISVFHVLSHVLSAENFVKLLASQLKKGAYVLIVDHDAAHFVHRLLGRSSPIFDSAHVTLWSREAMQELFQGEGLSLVETGAITNRYRLCYWNSLLPMPAWFKSGTARLLEVCGLSDKRVGWSFGNRYWVFHKQAHVRPVGSVYG